MYAKFGYLISSAMFEGQFYIALTSALIFGLFAGTATTATIVHNKKEDARISKELLFFDIAISCLFYLDVSISFWQAGKYGAMVAIVAFAIYTSRLLFHLSEQFRNANVEENKLQTANQQFNSMLTKLVNGLGIQLPTLTPSVAEMVEAIESRFKALLSDLDSNSQKAKALLSIENSHNDLTHKYNELRQEKENIGIELRRLMDSNSSLNEKLQLLSERNKELETELTEKQAKRKLASKQGYITQLRNEAQQLKNEGKAFEAQKKLLEAAEKEKELKFELNGAEYQN